MGGIRKIRVGVNDCSVRAVRVGVHEYDVRERKIHEQKQYDESYILAQPLFHFVRKINNNSIFRQIYVYLQEEKRFNCFPIVLKTTFKWNRI